MADGASIPGYSYVDTLKANDIPTTFCFDTGFLKKMTDATITITLFKQLPIECVTGETLCKIM